MPFLLNLKLIWFGSVSLTARCLPCLDFAYCVGMFPAAAARLFWTISDKGLGGQDRHTETHTHTLVEKESSDVEPSVLVKVQDALLPGGPDVSQQQQSHQSEDTCSGG